MKRYIGILSILCFLLFSTQACKDDGGGSPMVVMTLAAIVIASPATSCAHPSVQDLTLMDPPIYGSGVVKPVYFYRITTNFISDPIDLTLTAEGGQISLFVGDQNVILDQQNYKSATITNRYDADAADVATATVTINTFDGQFRCIAVDPGEYGDFSLSYSY
ncbi:hypothetical protein [Leptospira sarikeiensis]|uniref:Uncharacterized protein n=1 Tax=Leptospira sarikeiensis TaxID=2484943 RepID=A0A4V3JSL9_9LEPT|nr:hypothetical protein [Leptospira sarikeiensis]TGL65797.1 hypothetical protein EHQ64_00560 [Leptospira sarikeiensis]